MGSPTVRTITLADAVPAIDTVVLAFAGDPIARWSWPHSHQYLTSMPSLVRAFGGNAFSQSGAYCTNDYIGVALWLPPGVQPNEQALTEIIESTVSASVRADVFGMFEQMASYHPSAPHWYLPLIGVDPAHQGKGRRCADDLCAPAVRSRSYGGLPGVHEPTKHFAVPTSRL